MTDRQPITRRQFDAAISIISTVHLFENPTPMSGGFTNGHLQSTIKTLARYRDFWTAPDQPAPERQPNRNTKRGRR